MRRDSISLPWARLCKRVVSTLEPTWERANSSSVNRLVRTRLLGGVGAGSGNAPGYPIYPDNRVIRCPAF